MKWLDEHQSRIGGANNYAAADEDDDKESTAQKNGHVADESQINQYQSLAVVANLDQQQLDKTHMREESIISAARSNLQPMEDLLNGEKCALRTDTAPEFNLKVCDRKGKFLNYIKTICPYLVGRHLRSNKFR